MREAACNLIQSVLDDIMITYSYVAVEDVDASNESFFKFHNARGMQLTACICSKVPR